MLYQWSDGSIHRVPPPTEEELATVKLLTAHRTLFCKARQCGNTISVYNNIIEEAKKRWPNTPVPGEEKK